MVSYRRRKPKKPSPLFSVLDWLRILCSGCFGRIDRFKKPLPSAIPAAKLNLNMNNLVLDSYLRDGGDNIHSSMDRCHVFDPPTAFGDDDEVIADDADNEDGDGMFHGLFLLGSEVLTEVELQSPLEESRVLATSFRTPRRSTNSSRASSTRDLHESAGLPHVWGLGLRKSSDSSYASSTRELHLGSSQVCPLDSDSSCSLGASAVISPTRDVERDPMIVPSTDEENCTGSRSRNCAIKDALLSDSQSFSSPHLCKSDKDRVLTSSSSSSDLPSLRENGSHLDAQKMRPFPDGKESNTSWNKNKLDSRSGSAFVCNITDAPLKKVCRVADQKLAQDGTDHTPVGSLPSCTMPNLLYEKEHKKSDSRRLRTRSLTDKDFTELKGCIDLGFVFPEDHVPDLCETLPALEVCYAVAHGAISPASNMDNSKPLSPSSPPISPWRIASPGDQPQQVKTRLRQWAQAVACNVRHP